MGVDIGTRLAGAPFHKILGREINDKSRQIYIVPLNYYRKKLDLGGQFPPPPPQEAQTARRP